MAKFENILEDKIYKSLDGKVEIGNKSIKNKCAAHLLHKRFDGDAEFSMELDSDNLGTKFKNQTYNISFDGDKIIMTSEYVTLKFYKINDSRYENESMEYEVTLNKKPKGYIGGAYQLIFSIDVKNLEFIKQLSFKDYNPEMIEKLKLPDDAIIKD